MKNENRVSLFDEKIVRIVIHDIIFGDFVVILLVSEWKQTKSVFKENLMRLNQKWFRTEP